MRARHVVVTGAALVALAGCSAKPAAAPAPAAVGAASPSGTPAAAPSASVDAGTLDAASAYLAGLGRLDQRLVADQSVALDNGAATCVDLGDKLPEAVQQQNVATRFAVDAARATEILELAKSQLCLG